MIIIGIDHVVGGFDFTKLQVMHIFPSSTGAPVTGCSAGGAVVASERRD